MVWRVLLSIALLCFMVYAMFECFIFALLAMWAWAGLFAFGIVCAGLLIGYLIREF